MADCRLQRASRHVWWFTPDDRTDRASLAAVAGRDATLLLDAGASPTHTRAFLAALAPLDLPPVAGAALTHWHWDHSFGAAEIAPQLLAHRETAAELAVQRSYAWDDGSLDDRVADGREIAFVRDMLKLEIPDRRDLEIRIPDTVFADAHLVDLGGLTVELHHVGGDHASDAVVMWVPDDRLLFLGDCWYQRLYAPVEHYTLAGLRRLVARLLPFAPHVAIEGHGDELLGTATFAARLDELERACDLVDHHGQTAIAAAANDEVRDLVRLLLAGNLPHEQPDRPGKE